MKTTVHPEGDAQQPTVIGFEMPSDDELGTGRAGVMGALLDVPPSLSWAVALSVLQDAFALEHGLDTIRLVGQQLTISGRVAKLRRLPPHVREFVQQIAIHSMKVRHARAMSGAEPVVERVQATEAFDAAESLVDIQAIGRIPGIPAMLEAVASATGMGFAAVARVTDTRWTACVVHDLVGFGLKAGQDLELETTICNEIRQHGKPVFFDSASRDDHFANHATPAMYGFESYISVPIYLPDGTFFGTLCALDPKPAKITERTIRTLEMFASVIGREFEVERAKR